MPTKKAKPPATKARLVFPATNRNDRSRLTQALKKSPIYVKNFVYRPPFTRRSVKNNTLLLTKELEKSPMYVKNYLHRPSRTRKPTTRKSSVQMKKPLGIKI